LTVPCALLAGKKAVDFRLQGEGLLVTCDSQKGFGLEGSDLGAIGAGLQKKGKKAWNALPILVSVQVLLRRLSDKIAFCHRAWGGAAFTSDKGAQHNSERLTNRKSGSCNCRTFYKN
jgi:hypothetical protein